MPNITNYYQNVTNMQQLLGVANDQTGGWFYFGVSIMIFIVLLVSFLGFGFESAVVASSFITLILSVLLVYMGLMSWGWAMLYLGLFLLMIFYIAWNSRKE